jgi:hypothetical protein
LLDYLTGLRLTAAMNLASCYSGHGAIIRNPAKLIDERFAFHSARLDVITEIVESGADTAFAVAQVLWSEEVAATQTVLAIWEVLGHLDILVNRGTLSEDVDQAGTHSFHPTGALRIATANS